MPGSARLLSKCLLNVQSVFKGNHCCFSGCIGAPKNTAELADGIIYQRAFDADTSVFIKIISVV
ncbi:MAG: hypothetical protein EBU52_08000 [Cytophagia bacterium]|nr:hypothetical protein [Cytophagia bacterium]